MLKRIGFACKWYPEVEDGESQAEYARRFQHFNTRTTTVAALSELDSKQRRKKLHELVDHNLKATWRALKQVAERRPKLRMMRISSDLLPMATHAIAKDYYESKTHQEFAEFGFKKIGDFARDNNIRLSFHPDLFCLLSSASEYIVRNGIAEFEYHARCAELMGYTDWHQNGFCINIHAGSGKLPIDGFRRGVLKLSQVGRNLITVENDEFNWSAETLVKGVGDLVPIVLDVHHYWIREHRFIQPDDPIIPVIIESWKGCRPKLHLAMSKEELNIPSGPLDIEQLLSSGHNKSKLRAHSFDAWHLPTLDYIKAFADNFDIMWEGKNASSGPPQILAHWKNLT